MRSSDVPTPEIYKSSADFRFFLKWFSNCLSQVQNETDNIVDLLDPERCPASLLSMLCDTYGFQYVQELPPAFNRLVLLYFMSMIYNRGSKTGVTLAAEVNLAQFRLIEKSKESPEFEDRLVDKSIPVNSVYVNSRTQEGYIDIVYYSEEIPKDACIDYVRPLGMYCFTHPGVRIDSRNKISVDARLTDTQNMQIKTGPTHVGHYRRSDYASLQRFDLDGNAEPRKPVYRTNSKYEKHTSKFVDPGLRSLYSLQISNNEHVVKALVPSVDMQAIFSVGAGPSDVTTRYPDNYLKGSEDPLYNLRYDAEAEQMLGSSVHTLDPDRVSTVTRPQPAVNPMMTSMGEAMSMNTQNTLYTKKDANGNIVVTVPN